MGLINTIAQLKGLLPVSGNLAVEDILVRYHRMLGERTLWIPGTDSAAIATQSKVEKILENKNIEVRKCTI